MAKIQTLDWKAFHQGDIRKKATDHPASISKTKVIVAVVAAGAAFAICGDYTAAFASSADAVAVFAPDATVNTADFSDQLRKATKPIRDVIFAFGHEVYFVMMAWGGIEALIGKAPQGFARMKSATAAYIILYWVPWIVETVGRAVPH